MARKRPGKRITVAFAIAVLLALAAVTGCDSHTDDLAKVTRCLRGKHARVVASPYLSELAARRGWRVRRFFFDTQGLTVVVTSSDDAGRDALKRVVEAMATLGESPPAPQRRGKIVYWWDKRPSTSSKAAVDRCIEN
jgi:hypothetical protein